MRVIFAGTSNYAVSALSSILEAGYEIPLVLTQPDRAAGRGMKLKESDVKKYSLKKGLKILQPRSLNLKGKFPEIARSAIETLKSTKHDLMIVAAYGLILPSSVIKIPKYGCINIHASLLPRWRGAAPIHRAIEAGDEKTGITIMQMDEGLDTGPILMSESIDILFNDTTESLLIKLSKLGAELILDVLKKIEFGRINSQPQSSYGITYAKKIKKEESILNFNLPAKVLLRKINAFNPYPGSQFIFENNIIKVWSAKIFHAEGEPGKIINISELGPIFACGKNSLIFTVLQKPGGKKLQAKNFINGFKFDIK